MEAVHRSTASRLRRWGAVAAAGALFAVFAGPAGAAPVDTVSPVSGSITLSGNVTDLTGVVFDGTFDDATGALSGKLVFPPATFAVTSPVAATATIQITQPADGTGTIDLVGNTGTFTADLVLSIPQVAVTAGPTLQLAPCNFNFSLSTTGAWDPATEHLTLSQPSFALSPSGSDSPHCGAVGGLIDDTVTAGTNSLDAVLDLSVGNAPQPFQCPAGTTGTDLNSNGVVDAGECNAPPPTTPTTPTEPAPAAEPVAATPNTTG